MDINYKKNNLDKSSSPYLQQHKDNPIHWQEWSKDVIQYAKENNKIVFVSIGYSTCHWCHVMAEKTFSHKDVAQLLNADFVSIKVDKEQRPDIDSYMMSFMQETQGQGGWPLNVFLTGDLQPFLSVTYLPAHEQGGQGFLDLLMHLKHYYANHREEIREFTPIAQNDQCVDETAVIQTITNHFNHDGFGISSQFPPHNTLLFMLSYFEHTNDSPTGVMIKKILDTMARRGLHDHLQGGFFRYCVDYSWTIPHFEKMLYDQAMLLWIYSLAYKIFNNPEYKIVVEKLLLCLEDTYSEDFLYHSAHDADTDHQEGETYLWSQDELKEVLTKEELDEFFDLYSLHKVEDGFHLVKKRNVHLPKIEKKLLEIRKKRRQPTRDKKFVTSWNALLGIGMIVASRTFDSHPMEVRAALLFEKLLGKHYKEGTLHHSSLDGKLQKQGFLEDYATILLLATYIYEDTGGYKDLIEEFYAKVLDSKAENWIENKHSDFIEVSAPAFDHPTPSSVSLAEMALLRASIVLGKTNQPRTYKHALANDFYNLMVFISQGNWHIIYTPHKIPWTDLPANSMQVFDTKMQYCYKQICTKFTDVTELLEKIQINNQKQIK
jgi:uncharacterized protein